MTAASGQHVDPEALPFRAIELAGNTVEFDAFGEHWRCHLDDYACERAEFTPPGNPLEVPSPDTKVAVSLRGHDLWARSLSDGREWALTTDGEPAYRYGTSPEGLGNGTLLRKLGLPHLPPAVAWSPDSTKVLTHRTDERGVRQTHLVEARPADGGAPRLHTQRYAYPGDEEVPQAELVVLDVTQDTVVRAQAEPLLTPMVSPVMATWAWWAQDGSAVYYLSQPRDLHTLTLHRLDPATGDVATMLDFPEVYKAGVALSGPHDARYFNLSFVEAYDGADNPEAWARASNVDIAHRLAGKLLLVHGEMDDQVHPDHTLRLADRLIAADKDFELLIVPGAEHMFFDCLQYVRTRGWDFLVRELMGTQPPAYRPAPIAIDPEMLGELFA